MIFVSTDIKMLVNETRYGKSELNLVSMKMLGLFNRFGAMFDVNGLSSSLYFAIASVGPD
uniref:Uncharacterized protein n=1 Tax=Rhizophora mucronata TaxID=61149 RepID=A0A2P2N2H1_RHIMU